MTFASIPWRLLGVLALCLTLWGGGKYIMHLRGSLALAEARADRAEDALKRTQTTLASREVKRAATGRKTASAQASHGVALSKNQAWAETPVPQGVQDDLCKTVRCAVPPGADGVRNDSNNRP